MLITQVLHKKLFKSLYLCYELNVCACMLSRFSHVQVFVTLWPITCQALLSTGFSMGEYWSGWPCLPPGDLPGPGIEPASLMSPALAGRFFTTTEDLSAGLKRNRFLALPQRFWPCRSAAGLGTCISKGFTGDTDVGLGTTLGEPLDEGIWGHWWCSYSLCRLFDRWNGL